MTTPSRALITAAAANLLRRLQDRHGALMFHQSGGCCDGSSPMCYLDGEFLVGDRDVLLSILDVGSDLHLEPRPALGERLLAEHADLVVRIAQPAHR